MNKISRKSRLSPEKYSLLIITIFLLTAFAIPVFGQDEKPEIINNVPKSIPLKVEIIEPAKAEEYPERIRIKVTNTGDKPIYSIRMFLEINDPEKSKRGPDGKIAYNVVLREKRNSSQ